MYIYIRLQETRGNNYENRTTANIHGVNNIHILVVGCGPAGNTTPALTASPNNPTSSTPISTIPSTQPGSIVGSPFLPGEVLATLPVYPGATPTTDFNPGFGPPSFPSEQPIYVSRSPGYQSASAQYTTPAIAEDILNWYSAELGALGYNTI